MNVERTPKNIMIYIAVVVTIALIAQFAQILHLLPGS